MAKSKKSKKNKPIAKWAKHKLVVTPKVIRSFTDLKIKGQCNTDNKDKDDEKEFVTRKNGKPTEVSFTVELNALTGVSDVYGEAMKYVTEADEGKTDYLYLGGKKVLGIKLMLVTAEVTEVVIFPSKGNKWISCSVKLSFKKASKGKTKGGGDENEGGSNGFTARVYYTTSSGATASVTGWSSVSYADALKKAKAKVPRTASWTGTSPKSTKTRQMGETQPTLTAATLEAARKRAQQTSLGLVPKTTTTGGSTGLGARTQTTP